MPTTLTNGIQLPDKGSVDWYSSMQSNYNLIDTHLGNTDIHVTTEDKSRWDGKANASHTHTSSELTDIGDFATKSYVDTSIGDLVDSAPAALDTLKELSTALNDDANFATTVATALGNKANSADLATVATSGSYTDLNNKPSIPSKTSDLTNDSNFVDTSNSAVSSGITSAKVTSYDTHIVDTDKHVTTADKNKWNAGITQAYVVRYASVAVSDNSTVPYTNLNNTDNVKAKDLLLDINGKIYQISAVDTANETVSVTTPLTQLAVDSGVMHLSGNETVGGFKTFNRQVSIDGGYIGTEFSSNARTNLVLRANRDTAGKSCAYISRFRQNKSQGSMSASDLQMLSVDFVENNVRTNSVLSVEARGWVNDIPTEVTIQSSVSDYSYGGTSSPCKINNLNPGSLSLPDLNNAIDISGYITGGNSHNEYTPTVDGWISVILKSTSGALGLFLYQDNMVNGHYGSTSLPNESEPCVMANLPVKAGTVVNIDTKGSNGYVYAAKFFPCLGNV